MPYPDGLPIANVVASDDIIVVTQGSTGAPGTGVTRQATISQIASGAAGGVGNLTATGSTQATALRLPSTVSVFTTVASGTGAIIPPDASIGSIWDVWNNGANSLKLYPLFGAQIQNFGTNVAAGVAPGGRSTFFVQSSVLIVAR